jgi:hypothetical protein
MLSVVGSLIGLQSKSNNTMPIINQADLQTNMYAEVIEEITRADAGITELAIATAIQEAKTYLARYNLVALFGTDTTEPEIEDQYLKTLVKDITCWRLIRLCNTAVDYSVFRTAYLDAIAALTAIMKGQAQPDGWPYADTGNITVPEGTTVEWHSNPRRENHY